MFDVLIIGGGVSSIGLCKNKKFATEKNKFSLIKNHHLRKLFLITPIDSCRNIGLGFIVTKRSTAILMSLKYQTKSLKVEGQSPDFTITTNKNTYKTKVIVVTIGASNTFFN
jgi:hypothetical protein